jgi:hypothetical protein
MSLEDSYLQGATQPVTGYVPKLVNYSDATYKYTCLAKPGTSLTAAKWMVFRTEISTGNITHADSGRFTQVATNVSLVAALSYT